MYPPNILEQVISVGLMSIFRVLEEKSWGWNQEMVDNGRLSLERGLSWERKSNRVTLVRGSQKYQKDLDEVITKNRIILKHLKKN